MYTNRIKQALKLILIILLPLAGSGCMVIKGKQLAKLDPLQKQALPKLSSVMISASHSLNGKPSANVAVSEKLEDNYVKSITSVLEESGYFKSINSDATKNVATDYLLHYQVDEKGNTALAMISGFITGFSFFTIPGGGSAHMTVDASLSDSSGNVLFRKQYKDKITIVMWLPLLPFSFSEEYSIFKAQGGFIENMVRHSVVDLQKQMDNR